MRKLKAMMIVFGAILAIEGLLDLVFPVQRAAGMGLGPCAEHAQLPMAVLGATWLVAGVWSIASARDPLRHLNWVKFVLTLPLALMLGLLLAVLRGDVAGRQVAVDIAVDAFFVLAFVAFYPRNKREQTHPRQKTDAPSTGI